NTKIEAAPSFYAVATSAPWGEVITAKQDAKHQVSVARAIKARQTAPANAEQERFTEAVIRIRSDENLYQLLENEVTVDQQTLFRTSIEMPSNLTEGHYDTRILLTRNGAVISTLNTEIDVRKVGLERFLFSLSREQPLVYGLLSLAIAIFAGWGASGLFSALRRS
ncbi:MAG: TIGR02186 family protein, partial [Marinovum sp.]|nr:TIGR02186 family protein [Marinovum sp.]